MQPCRSNYTIPRVVQLKTIVLYCRRNVRVPMHSSPPRKFSECASRFLIHPDNTHKTPCRAHETVGTVGQKTWPKGRCGKPLYTVHTRRQAPTTRPARQNPQLIQHYPAYAKTVSCSSTRRYQER